MRSDTALPASKARSALASFITLIATIALAHGLTAILPGADLREVQALNALSLTVAAIIVGSIGCMASFHRSVASATVIGGLAGAAAMVVLAATGLAHWSGGLSLLLVGMASGAIARWAASHLPSGLEEAAHENRRFTIVWLLLALLAVLQVGRLATFATAPDFDWFLLTRDPYFARHMCLPAYIYGAELNERGDPNIYATEHYLALNPDAAPETRFDMLAEDPFQYPPPFLLLPRLATWLSGDFQAIYAVWLTIQITAFLAVAVALARWVGGRAGSLAALSLPLFLLAVPTLSNLQYGQFHLMAILLTVAAMLAFDSGRNALGGGLLGFAILSKIFPGIFLVWLAMQRRWAPVAWTVAACAVVAVGSLPVVGIAPFETFVTYQLPRLGDGSAFAFASVYPEFEGFLIAINQSYLGIVQKLGVLGLPGMTPELASTAGRLFGLFVLVVAVVAARRTPTSRADRAAAWLSLAGLASLTSAGAWGDYIGLPALWLLTFMGARMLSSRTLTWTLGLLWFFLFFIPGSMPIGSWFPLRFMVSLSLIGALALHAFYLVVLLGSSLRLTPLDR